jgi:hypothetical protein
MDTQTDRPTDRWKHPPLNPMESEYVPLLVYHDPGLNPLSVVCTASH